MQLSRRTFVSGLLPSATILPAACAVPPPTEAAQDAAAQGYPQFVAISESAGPWRRDLLLLIQDEFGNQQLMIGYLSQQTRFAAHYNCRGKPTLPGSDVRVTHWADLASIVPHSLRLPKYQIPDPAHDQQQDRIVAEGLSRGRSLILLSDYESQSTESRFLTSISSRTVEHEND